MTFDWSALSDDQRISVVVFGTLLALTALAWLRTSAVLVTRFVRSRALVRVRGEVVAHEERLVRMSSNTGGHSKRVLLAAVVRFVGADGIERTVASQVASNVPPPLGTAVDVAHPQGRPDEAIVDSALARWFAPVLVWLVLTALVPLFVGVGLHALSRG